MVVKQYDVFLIRPGSTVGREAKKIRPCAVVSPNEMNESISTVIIAPMTTKSHPYPSRIPIRFRRKHGWVVLDQLRAADKRRLLKKAGRINAEAINRIKRTLREMLAD